MTDIETAQKKSFRETFTGFAKRTARGYVAVQEGGARMVGQLSRTVSPYLKGIKVPLSKDGKTSVDLAIITRGLGHLGDLGERFWGAAGKALDDKTPFHQAVPTIAQSVSDRLHEKTKEIGELIETALPLMGRNAQAPTPVPV